MEGSSLANEKGSKQGNQRGREQLKSQGGKQSGGGGRASSVRRKPPVRVDLPTLQDGIEKFIWVGLMALGAIVPMIISTQLGQQIHFPKMIAIQIVVPLLLVAWVIGLFFSERARIRRGPLDVPVLLFLSAALVTAIFSSDTGLSFFGKYRNAEGLLQLAAYASIYWLAVQVQWSARRVRGLMWAVVSGGFLVSIYGLAQHVGWDFISWNKVPFTVQRSFATFGNPSLLGGYLTIVLSLAVGIFLSSRQLWQKLLVSPVIIASAGCIVTTYTRGAWVGCVLSAIIILAYPLIRMWRLGFPRADFLHYLRQIAIVVAVAAVGIGYYLAEPYLKPGEKGTTAITELSTISRLASGVSDGSIQDRFGIWNSALRMMADRPLVGQGPDTFQLRFGQFQTIESARIEKANAHAEDAHNYLLAVSGTMGLLGLTGLLTILVALVLAGYTRMRPPADDHDASVRSGRGPPDPQHLRWDSEWTGLAKRAGILAAIAGYAADVFFTINVVGGAFLFWLLIGLVSGTESRRVDSVLTPSTQRAGAWPATITSSLIAAYVVFLSVTWVIADVGYARAQNGWTASIQAQSIPGLDATKQEFYRAFEANPRMDRYLSDLSQRYVELAFQTGIPQFWESAREVNDLALKHRPLEPWFHINAGIIEYKGVFPGYPQAGVSADAEERARVIQELRLRKAQDLPKAETNLKEAIRLYPNSARANYFFGLFLADLSRFEEAEKHLLKAVDCDPQYRDALFATGQFYHQRYDAAVSADSKGSAELRTKARKYYKMAVAVDPAYSEAIEAIKALTK